MQPRLPFDQLLIPVRQISAAVGAVRLARYDAALLCMPLNPSKQDWNVVPHAEILKALFAQKVRKAGDTVSLRVGPRAQTLLIVTAIGATASTFERLQAGAKLTRLLLDGDPRSILIWQQGCDSPAAQSAALGLLAALQAGAFRLASFKSKPKPAARLARIDVAIGAKSMQLDYTLACAAGNNMARWLTALPPNYLDARGYRRLAEQFAAHIGVSAKFYSETQLKALGAGAFLAVSAGNGTRDAGILHLSYRPRGAAGADISLVGKGICFDTGGTNLKPHKSMLDMHTDMAGSAVALGTLYALHAMRSPHSVDCWLAITENRIGPLAYKPQDVVRALNGTTIQVIHTDAEGRMVLADALALAASKRPRLIIDYATLTGACVYALTERYSGAFTNRPQSRDVIEAAGAACGERVWCFPMDGDYDGDLESQVADVMQCPVEGKGDHILAARFLNRFVPADIPWLHIDLSSGTRHGGLGHITTDITGFGVRFTLELLGRGWPAAAA